MFYNNIWLPTRKSSSQVGGGEPKKVKKMEKKGLPTWEPLYINFRFLLFYGLTVTAMDADLAIVPSAFTATQVTS